MGEQVQVGAQAIPPHREQMTTEPSAAEQKAADHVATQQAPAQAEAGATTASAQPVAGQAKAGQANVDQHLLDAVNAAPASATLNNINERLILSLVRPLAAVPERVWPLLTQPEQLALWSPIVPNRALDRIGMATSQEDPEQPPVLADVLAAAAPTVLSHRWGQDTLRWELSVPQGAPAGGCQVALQHSFTDRDMAPSMAAGWHICLAALALLAQGQQVDRPVGERAMEYGWEKLHTRYAEKLGI